MIFRPVCLSAAFLFVIIISCAAPIKQFYPDRYYPEDRIYENKPLHFVLQFQGNWELLVDPNDMDKETQKLVKHFARAGAELLFMGATVEGQHGTRGIAVNLNEPAKEYADYIRRLNANDVQNDQGITDMAVGTLEMEKWIYDKGEFRFAEIFFAIDSYDIRISFWTRAENFDKFLPVYESIIASLEVTGGL